MLDIQYFLEMRNLLRDCFVFFEPNIFMDILL